jgi:hypothetical protein
VLKDIVLLYPTPTLVPVGSPNKKYAEQRFLHIQYLKKKIKI